MKHNMLSNRLPKKMKFLPSHTCDGFHPCQICDDIERRNRDASFYNKGIKDCYLLITKLRKEIKDCYLLITKLRKENLELRNTREEDNVQISTAKSKINRWGARKYASISSKTRLGLTYYVVKYRKYGTRNYKYSCTCESFVNRRIACKHIKMFKARERKDMGK